MNQESITSIHGTGIEFRDDPHVHYPYFCPNMSGEYIDSRTACKKCPDHLSGNLLGIRVHPFGDHAVVAGHYQDNLTRYRRLERLFDSAQLFGDVMQFPQRPKRHYQLSRPVPGGFDPFFFYGSDAIDDLFQSDISTRHFFSSFSFCLCSLFKKKSPSD